MNILTVLADPILPVFGIIAVGYAMGRAGRTSIAEARLINRISLTVFLPALLFDLLANAPIHEFNMAAVLLYTSVQAIIFTMGFLLARRVFQRPADESVLLAFCGIFANNAFYVLPISLLLYGESGVLPITTVLTMDTTVTFAGVMIALQLIKLGRVAPLEVVTTIGKTPLLYAIALGVIFSLARFEIPTPLQTFLDFNGVAAAPVALYALGVVMSTTTFVIDRSIVTFTLVKLLLFPAVIWAGLRLFGLMEGDGALFLLGSAGPAGTMAFSLALLHGVRTDAIVMIMIFTSVLTLFTLAALA
ncbi:AEC family transporter [Granulosicoccus antarcticus]|uniref:Transporter YfdV n=1 Tax=Granulosicoccus antarcticus IMCC3135 TaxID=1192854 RepID=A0A2Z2NXY2_9GAMM|nr:AEC family transporter [Granulosicoccus antarcticus]ASJ76139.1 hypothetical protein IMCC3135_30450 [Granulosicoccus antarcticus IMCC3135]